MYKGVTREPVLVILLSLITCGIYYLYWLWQVKNDINGILGREEISVGLYIAAIFVPFVYLLIWYKTDAAFIQVCPEKGIPYAGSFILWLILTLIGIGTIVAIYQIQSTFNKLWIVN
ncbi:MAG: DUF4234 domain-containing protein [Oscillospiraceae bacterium]|jgi:hypothetical protein|nr:DUF4234 domain-containing protein [Oscillospiraceae bacterium]